MASKKASGINPYKKQEKFLSYAFVLPAMALLVLFLIVPSISALRYSFTYYNVMRPDNIHFVGLGNFKRVFTDAIFGKALLNTFYFTFLVVPLQCLLALGLALLVRRSARGVGIFRAAYFSPMVTSMVVIALLWSFLYNPNPNQGLINAFIVKLGGSPVPFLRGVSTAMNSIIVMSAWQACGYQMMIFVAGLQNIPEEQYEAASIDGAGTFKKFWYVTIPGLMNVIKYVVIMTTIQAMKLFVQPYIMTQGGPQNSTRTMVYYIYQQGFQNRNFGYACTLAVVFFVVVVLFTFVLKRVIRAK